MRLASVRHSLLTSSMRRKSSILTKPFGLDWSSQRRPGNGADSLLGWPISVLCEPPMFPVYERVQSRRASSEKLRILVESICCQTSIHMVRSGIMLLCIIPLNPPPWRMSELAGGRTPRSQRKNAGPPTLHRGGGVRWGLHGCYDQRATAACAWNPSLPPRSPGRCRHPNEKVQGDEAACTKAQGGVLLLSLVIGPDGVVPCLHIPGPTHPSLSSTASSTSPRA